MQIRQVEKGRYDEVWSIPGYAQHAPGERWASLFTSIAGSPTTVLDAGCGSGKGASALQQLGWHVALMDLTRSGLVPEVSELPFFEQSMWQSLLPLPYLAHLTNPQFTPLQFDWVYCTDVMEHIPTALTMLTVHRLREVAHKGLFFSISLTPDLFGVWVGHPLHATVQSFTWWRDMLGEVGSVVEARDLLTTGIYVLDGVSC